MIPRAMVEAWREVAPWQEDYQVEQDLILSRALCEIYSRPALGESLAFRGGTALNKLYLHPSSRYSEDLDFVQLNPGPIGSVLDELRAVLDPWLGNPRWERKEGSVKLKYSYEAGSLPVRQMKVKIEINTREHLALLGRVELPLEVDNEWFDGRARVSTFALDELLATKMRALYQRSKGRDLYDLWKAISLLEADSNVVVELFRQYLQRSGLVVSRAEFEANMSDKLASEVFRRDVAQLLRDVDDYHIDEAAAFVRGELIARLPGDPWAGNSGAA